MSKFLMRMGSKKEQFLVSMTIVSLEIPVKETIKKVSIEWKRGNKKSETKTPYVISEDEQRIEINETFTKQSKFYKNTKTGTYFKKLALFRVKGHPTSMGGKEKILGELELDISLFMNSAGESKTLQLRKAPPNSHIDLEISI